MASKKNIIGLASLLLGDIAADGGMGTDLTEVLGATVKGSASLIYTPPSLNDITTEEDGLYDQVKSQDGKWELKLESYNVSAKAMGVVCGGVYTEGAAGAPDTWEGDEIVHMEKSARATTKNGAIIDIPRLKYIASPSFSLTDSDLGKLSLAGAALQPTKAGIKKVKKTDAPA